MRTSLDGNCLLHNKQAIFSQSVNWAASASVAGKFIETDADEAANVPGGGDWLPSSSEPPAAKADNPDGFSLR